ncbi:MAG: hypothetical protein M5U28_23515 [Sandaracinaceae bacterium]|nr:hypothetical protein [Sandaracinaceae bacterium]
MRAHAKCVGIDEASFKQYDVHIHVPTGAVPKDGPSAGVVMAAALVSLFTGRPMRAYVAMTGEITLSGLLLPVGGVKEKVLAARRSGVRELILPAHNREQLLEEVPAHLRERMMFRFAGTIAEAIELGLQPARADAPAIEPTMHATVSPTA